MTMIWYTHVHSISQPAKSSALNKNSKKLLKLTKNKTTNRTYIRYILSGLYGHTTSIPHESYGYEMANSYYTYSAL